MKKKIILATLTMVLSIGALAGCGGGSSNSNASTQTQNNTSANDTAVTNDTTTPDTSNANTQTDQVIEVFQFKVEFAEAFDRMASDYFDETGVRVEVTTVGGGTDYGPALRTNFSSGEGPAIYNIGGPDDVDTWLGSLADLSDMKSVPIASSGSLEPVSRDGNIYGIPFAIEGYGLIYNKEVFEKAGIDPQSITNFEQLRSAVVELDSKKDELGIQAVFAFPAAETWVTGLHTLNPVIAGEFGDIIATFDAKTLDFTYADQYKQIIDLQNNYSVQPTVTLDYSQQVERLFSLGEVAMIQQGNWVYGSIEGIDADFAENKIGMIPLQYEGINENTLPVGVPMYWAVNSNLDQATQQAAKDFLDWMYTSETGKNYVLDEFKFIPAYEGYDLDRISDPLSRDVYSYASQGNSSNWVFMGFPTDWGMGVVGTDIQAYVSGVLEWDDLIQNAKDRWNSSRE